MSKAYPTPFFNYRCHADFYRPLCVSLSMFLSFSSMEPSGDRDARLEQGGYVMPPFVFATLLHVEVDRALFYLFYRPRLDLFGFVCGWVYHFSGFWSMDQISGRAGRHFSFAPRSFCQFGTLFLFFPTLVSHLPQTPHGPCAAELGYIGS